MNKSPAESLNKIKTLNKEIYRKNNGKTRISIQLGQCSISVDTNYLFESISKSLPSKSHYLVTTGCDGACYKSPLLNTKHSSGAITEYKKLDLSKTSINEIFSTSNPTPSDEKFFKLQNRVVLDKCGEIDPYNILEYLEIGGYQALIKTLSTNTQSIIDLIEKSELTGRGGAYFPVAIKWNSVKKIKSRKKFLVINAEEGEPGIFKDRHIMEGIPHRIIEGAIIASYATGVEEILLYINAEANLSYKRMNYAIEEAYRNNILGENILGSAINIEMKIIRGAGGYVCGEETTLLNTVEGYRREPRLKPPFPTESGLWENPTLINNVETLSNVPYIINNGPEVFKKNGINKSFGTKIISLSGAIKKPGVIEVNMGTSIRNIIYEIGGGINNDKKLQAIAIGGPSSGILPTSYLDEKIRGGMIHDKGIMLGAGGIIAIDEKANLMELLIKLMSYNADESCGKCTPCREGTPKMVELLKRINTNNFSPKDLEELLYISKIVKFASLCGLGQAAGNPIESFNYFFPDIITSNV
ncbi:MAG: NADH-quinone oxidoreductase subunit F [Dehalococcoidia bacterium]|nr:SLBB domain-containing protein [SAR202 cluster bacterium]